MTKWSELAGKTIRVEASLDRVQSIGHITKDDWFDPSLEFSRKAADTDEEKKGIPIFMAHDRSELTVRVQSALLDRDSKTLWVKLGPIETPRQQKEID